MYQQKNRKSTPNRSSKDEKNNNGKKRAWPTASKKNVQGMSAAIRPRGASFRKGRSQDMARDVTRIRPEAATDADPRGRHEMATPEEGLHSLRHRQWFILFTCPTTTVQTASLHILCEVMKQ